MSLESQIKNLSLKKLKMNNGMTITQIMNKEILRLYDCIQKQINAYYDSYSPTRYRRTDHLRHSLMVNDFLDISFSAGSLKVQLEFNPTLAYHDNFTGGVSYVPLLINDGWHWTGVKMPASENGDHLLCYGGFHFLEKGIAEWKQNNKLGLKVVLIKQYRNRIYSRISYK